MLPGTSMLMAETPQPSAPVEEAVDLPGYVAFETAHYLALGLALRSASCDVLPVVRPSCLMRTPRRGKVQAAIGIPVTTSVESVPNTTFPEDASMGETPQRPLESEASLFRRCGLSPRPLSAASLHGVRTDTRKGGQSSGAASATSRSPTAHRVRRFLRRAAGSAVPPSAQRELLRGCLHTSH
jgi:hypothetical protein